MQKQMVEVSARLHLFTFEKSRIGFCSRQPLHALHLVLQCRMHQGRVTAKDDGPVPPGAVCAIELRWPPEVPCVNTNLPFTSSSSQSLHLRLQIRPCRLANHQLCLYTLHDRCQLFLAVLPPFQQFHTKRTKQDTGVPM